MEVFTFRKVAKPRPFDLDESFAVVAGAPRQHASRSDAGDDRPEPDYPFLGRSVLATDGARPGGSPGGLGTWTFFGFFASLLPCFPLLMIVSLW